MAGRDYTGIERRIDGRGIERCRGYLRQHGRRINGPWGTYEDARSWRIHKQAAILEGESIVPETRTTLTVRDVSDTWLRGIKDGAILSRRTRAPYAAKTVVAYRQAFRDYINPELGHINLGKLTTQQVQRWVDWLIRDKKLGNGTVRNTWSALAAFYAYVVRRYEDVSDPTTNIDLPRPAEIRERYAPPSVIRALLDPLPLQLALPYALAFYAGLRHAEIQALPIDAVDIEEGWIAVRWQYDPLVGFKKTKSEAGLRDVPVFASLKPYLVQQQQLVLLKQHSDETQPGSLLLPSRRASKWGVQMFGRPFKRQCERLWIERGLQPIGLHEARHSFVTWLERAGYDVKTISEWAGHANITTTLDVYTKRRGREAGIIDRGDAYLST